MGYDLSNKSGGYVRFSGSGWDLVLAVARHYGWKPAGIPKPPNWNDAKNGPWEDEYWFNAGQEVTADDAAAMASALSRAAVAPDAIQIIEMLRKELMAFVNKTHPAPAAMFGPMTDDDAAKFRQRVVEFAEFAAGGPFIIE
jgi:hypothetical protein